MSRARTALRRFAIAGGAVAVACAGLTAVAQATPVANAPRGFSIEYPVAGTSSSAVGPLRLTTAPDGSVWFSSYSGGNIGRFQLPSTLNQYPIPSSSPRPGAITVGPDGNIWFAETAYDQIGRVSLSPACYGTITEFTIPGANGGGISGLVSDGAHHLWFSAAGGDEIGSLDTSSGVIPSECFNQGKVSVSPFDVSSAISSYALRPDSGPNGIALDRFGSVWFAESVSGRIGRIDTSVAPTAPNFEYLTEWATPTAASNPLDIVVGPDNRMWFSEDNANRIGVISAAATAGGSPITEYSLGSGDLGPAGITAGPDGAIWIAESTNASGAIGRLTTHGVFTQYATAPAGGAIISDVAVNKDGSVWYTNFLTESIGAMSSGVHPARVAASMSPLHVGSLVCSRAQWGSAVVASHSTLQRDGVTLAALSTTLKASDVGHTFACQSRATLAGLMPEFASSVSFKVTALLTKSAYTARVGGVAIVGVLSSRSQSVRAEIVRSNGSVVTFVPASLHSGYNTVRISLRSNGKSVGRGRYLVRIVGAAVPRATVSTVAVR